MSVICIPLLRKERFPVFCFFLKNQCTEWKVSQDGPRVHVSSVLYPFADELVHWDPVTETPGSGHTRGAVPHHTIAHTVRWTGGLFVVTTSQLALRNGQNYGALKTWLLETPCPWFPFHVGHPSKASIWKVTAPKTEAAPWKGELSRSFHLCWNHPSSINVSPLTKCYSEAAPPRASWAWSLPAAQTLSLPLPSSPAPGAVCAPFQVCLLRAVAQEFPSPVKGKWEKTSEMRPRCRGKLLPTLEPFREVTEGFSTDWLFQWQWHKSVCDVVNLSSNKPLTLFLRFISSNS